MTQVRSPGQTKGARDGTCTTETPQQGSGQGPWRPSRSDSWRAHVAVTSQEDAATTPSLLRRYTWWPLLLCAAWLGAVAIGPSWPHVLMGPPCVLVPLLVAARGPFSRSTNAGLLRATTVLLPMVLVAALNPHYSFGRGMGFVPQQPGVITAAEVATQVARLELVAIVLVEAVLLTAAPRRRSD